MTKIKQNVFLELDPKDLSKIQGGDNESYDAAYKFGKWVGKTVNNVGKWVCKHAPWC